MVAVVLAPGVQGRGGAAPALDGWMMFGFLVAVVFIAGLTVNRMPQASMGVSAVCLAALGVYSFGAGAWPAGIVLLTLGAIEVRHWLAAVAPNLSRRLFGGRRRVWRNYVAENRVTGLFDGESAPMLRARLRRRGEEHLN